MISSEKNSAGPTSLQASMIASKRDSSGLSRSMCLCAFSIMTIAASTIAPIAIAMPPRLMMFEFMPSACMAMNAISTPTGSITIATSALRTCIRKITHTAATMIDSSISVRLSVSMARAMSSDRSYTALIDTPSGRPDATSAILAFTLSITSSAFWPKRAITMPATTSPSPLSSVSPRRSSGTNSTRATSLIRTGVPPSALSTSFSMSLGLRR